MFDEGLCAMGFPGSQRTVQRLVDEHYAELGRCWPRCRSRSGRRSCCTISRTSVTATSPNRWNYLWGRSCRGWHGPRPSSAPGCCPGRRWRATGPGGRPMDCRTARLLLEFARPRAGELQGSDADALEGHLLACAECESLARLERLADE